MNNNNLVYFAKSRGEKVKKRSILAFSGAHLVLLNSKSVKNVQCPQELCSHWTGQPGL